MKTARQKAKRQIRWLRTLEKWGQQDLTADPRGRVRHLQTIARMRRRRAALQQQLRGGQL